MGKDRLTQDVHVIVKSQATSGGQHSATHHAEMAFRQSGQLNPLVDPKGPPHLGPLRESRPRFEQEEDGTWRLTCGIPMAEETLLDTTASMSNNIELAFEALPKVYNMLVHGRMPMLGRYDVHMATATFGDIQEHPGKPVLCRTQFEMDEKIARQMTQLVPGKGGAANHKEDAQYGLFAAAYLTQARINAYGLKRYHFTVSDEPVDEYVESYHLLNIFGQSLYDQLATNGCNMSYRNLPDTNKIVKDLQAKAHAFFLFVPGHPEDHDRAEGQWKELYGKTHFIELTDGTRSLHLVKALIIGLTEGVISLSSAMDFLLSHGVERWKADQLVRAVAHIPIGAQTMLPNFNKLPKIGDRFVNKTDLWPIDQSANTSLKNDSDGTNSGNNNFWL